MINWSPHVLQNHSPYGQETKEAKEEAIRSPNSLSGPSVAWILYSVAKHLDFHLRKSQSPCEQHCPQFLGLTVRSRGTPSPVFDGYHMTQAGAAQKRSLWEPLVLALPLTFQALLRKFSPLIWPQVQRACLSRKVHLRPSDHEPTRPRSHSFAWPDTTWGLRHVGCLARLPPLLMQEAQGAEGQTVLTCAPVSSFFWSRTHTWRNTDLSFQPRLTFFFFHLT